MKVLISKRRVFLRECRRKSALIRRSLRRSVSIRFCCSQSMKSIGWMQKCDEGREHEHTCTRLLDWWRVLNEVMVVEQVGWSRRAEVPCGGENATSRKESTFVPLCFAPLLLLPPRSPVLLATSTVVVNPILSQDKPRTANTTFLLDQTHHGHYPNQNHQQASRCFLHRGCAQPCGSAPDRRHRLPVLGKEFRAREYCRARLLTPRLWHRNTPSTGMSTCFHCAVIVRCSPILMLRGTPFWGLITH